MLEVTLRKWHRRMGITLALFIVLQAGSGLVISVKGVDRGNTWNQTAPTVHDHDNLHNAVIWQNSINAIHHGGGPAGSIYRILVGFGTLGMALSGAGLFLMMINRMKRRNIS